MLAILLICLANAQLSMKVSENVLKSICSVHEGPPFCLKALKSDPRTPLVDLVGLTNISMHFTDVAANKTFARIISSLVNKTTNPNLKASYEVCLKFYDSIFSNQEEAKTAFKDRDYFSAHYSGFLPRFDGLQNFVNPKAHLSKHQKNNQSNP
nr:pectinesterase inhibitor [Quercus suber]